MKYAQNYIKNKKNDKLVNNKSYIAYNYEDVSESYTKLNDKGYPIDISYEKPKLFKSKSESNIKSYNTFKKNLYK